MIANKSSGNQLHEVPRPGTKSVTVWGALHNPKNPNINAMIADSLSGRMHVVVAKAGEIEKNRRLNDPETQRVNAAICAHMNEIIEIANNTKGNSQSLDMLNQIIAKMEADVKAAGATTQKEAAAPEIRKVLPKMQDAPAQSEKTDAIGLLGKFRNLMEDNYWAAVSAKVEETLRTLPKESLCTIESVVFEGKEDIRKTKYLYSPHMQTMPYKVAVICAVAKDLFDADGKVERGKFEVSLDYVWQNEKETGGSFWAKHPGPCWIAEMRVTGALRRNPKLVKRDEKGFVTILKG